LIKTQDVTDTQTDRQTDRQTDTHTHTYDIAKTGHLHSKLR